MKAYCSFHKNEHEDSRWKSVWKQNKKMGKVIYFCQSAWGERPETSEALVVAPTKTDRRLAHWKEIKSRVTTHEGEMLNGVEGISYQKKWSKQYLGRDMSRPVNFDRPEYQKELHKT